MLSANSDPLTQPAFGGGEFLRRSTNTESRPSSPGAPVVSLSGLRPAATVPKTSNPIDTMKLKTCLVFSALLAMLALAQPVAAQTVPNGGTDTNTPAGLQPPGNFFQSLTGYLTQQNTNFTFTGSSFCLSVGADYLAGQNWANYVSLDYNVSGRWEAGAKIRNLGIAGVISSMQAGVGYELYKQNDTLLLPSLYVGYDRLESKPMLEPTLTLRKKGTANTYFELGISVPFYPGNSSQKWTPNIFVGTGVTF